MSSRPASGGDAGRARRTPAEATGVSTDPDRWVSLADRSVNGPVAGRFDGRRETRVKKTILEARQEVSRQEILGAAKRLFAEQGVRATSLAKLAEELGITKAALYYYFASKQEIVVEAVRANVSDFGADVMGPIPEGLSAGEHLGASLERKVQRAERDGPLDLRFFYTVMLEELDVPEVERVYQEFFAEGRGADACDH